MELRDYLARAEKTLSEFAKEVGTSQPSLTRYAAGERDIPARVAEQIERKSAGAVTVGDMLAARKRWLRAQAKETA